VHQTHQADTIDKYNGLDITLLFAFGIQVGITVLYIIFMDFQDNSQLSVPGVYGCALCLTTIGLIEIMVNGNKIGGKTTLTMCMSS